MSSSGACGTSMMKSRDGSRMAPSLSSPCVVTAIDRAAARLHLLHVADHLLEHMVARRDRDDRHLLVDERDRAVLHLAGRIAFGVDVRNLLELQRAFEGDRVVDAAAEVEKVASRL